MEAVYKLYELISGKEFSVPLWEVIVFVIFNSMCLLFGRYRLGLLTSYCFAFYWGFLSNLENFSDTVSSPAWGMSLYVFSGFLMFIIAIIGFFVQSRD